MSELKELEPEAPKCAQLHGAGPLVEYQQSAGPRLVLGWSRRGKMKGTRHGLPPIDSKGGLTATTTLQSGLSREPDVL